MQGMPVRRPRLYMFGHKSCDPSLQHQATQTLRTLMLRATYKPLDRFLFSENPEMFQDWFEPHKPASTKRASQKDGWRNIHAYQWHLVPFSHDKDTHDAILRVNPFYQSLAEREKDVLLMNLCCFPLGHKFPPTQAWGLEASSNRTTHSSEEAAPCLLPNAKMWIPARERLLLGVEAMILQGADPNYLVTLRPRAWEDSFLRDLAGNAFCAYQFAAWVAASMSAVIGNL